MSRDVSSIEGIAIIGMAGRFPGARNIDEFWNNLVKGKESVSTFSDEECLASGVPKPLLDNPNFIRRGGVLEDIDLFDATFFGYSPREAAYMDPQQRIFLECAQEALENAGCCPSTYDGAIGVFAGCGINYYLLKNLISSNPLMESVITPMVFFGNDKDFLSTRVSYKLNLTGPSITVQSACSTSLTAIHLACQSLLTYQCDMALSGGVSFQTPRMKGYLYIEGQIFSSDGYCRAFDKDATGTVFGEGAGIVVLKRVEDAIADRDTIYAVIRGIAVNNDGSEKAGFTAPSVDGQAAVIAFAQGLSDIAADDISYIETHGTGTKLGDPIEIEGLTEAFRLSTQRNGYCAIGSVKPNIGHLDAAAGVASIIKTALALKHKTIPPSINYSEANPELQLENTPFFVNDRLREWQTNGKPRIAGVSSFGVGGTNSHAIMQEAPAVDIDSHGRHAELLLLSAKTEKALQDRTNDLCDYLRANPGGTLTDVAYTLQMGRTPFQHRKAVACRDADQAISALGKTSGAKTPPPVDNQRNKKIAFMFSGQGSQYINMCRDLYNEESFFKSQIDDCSEQLKAELGIDLRNVLFPSDEDQENSELIDQTWITQPVLFTVEYALARLLMEWGLEPSAMVGHSIGEYVAACISGVFSLADALVLVAGRGRMIQALEPGSMLSVTMSKEDLIPILPRYLSVAVSNAPNMTVVSGETERIEAFQDYLYAEKGLSCQRVHTSHAFHSEMMAPIVESFEKLVGSFARKRPVVPFVSNLTGTWITEDEATSPHYWAQHLLRTVRFHECMTTLLGNGCQNFVEVGPGQALTLFAKRHPEIKDSLVLPTTPHPKDKSVDGTLFLLNMLGQLWEAGIEINWQRNWENRNGFKIPLPTYPFQRQRHWIKADGPTASFAPQKIPTDQDAVISPVPDEKPTITVQSSRNDLELQVSNIFSEVLGYNSVDVRDSFFDLGGDSLLAAQLLARIHQDIGTPLSLADVFKYPSVEALAGQIQSGGGQMRATILELNQSSSDHLIYFVVGIQIYHALAQRLADNACCYGAFLPVEETLFGAGIRSDEWTVTDLASSYRDKILEHSAGRPLSIVGVSFGGVVCYELARQLSAEGVEIPLIVMLDSLLPSGVHRNYHKWVAAKISSVAKHGVHSIFKKIRSRMAAIREKRSRLSQGTKNQNGMVTDKRLVVYADAVERFEATDTSTTYGGRTLLIRALEGFSIQFPGYDIDPHFGWKKHLIGKFNIESVPGDHLGILKPPNVDLTAKLIQGELEDIAHSQKSKSRINLSSTMNLRPAKQPSFVKRGV